MEIKLVSSPDTPKVDLIYVIETPSVNRVKIRKVDILRELKEIEDELKKLKARKVELTEIKSGITSLE